MCVLGCYIFTSAISRDIFLIFHYHHPHIFLAYHTYFLIQWCYTYTKNIYPWRAQFLENFTDRILLPAHGI